MTGGEVTIAVCTRNRRDMLARTLESLTAQEVPGEWNAEVLVIDNGSTDGTGEWVQSFAHTQDIAVRYVREDRIGVAAARNRAVREAAGEWIAFIDDDETAEPGWLRALLDTVAETGADIVGGRVVLALPAGVGETIRGTARKHLDETVERRGLARRLTYSGPGTGNVLIRCAVFDQVGSFDETLSYRGEDQDFFRRAARTGYRIVRTENAVVRHHFPAERLTPEALLATARTNGRSLAYFDLHYEGRAYALGIMLLRALHAMAVTLPRYAMARFAGDRDGAWGYACSLATARSYIGEAARLLSGGRRRND